MRKIIFVLIVVIIVLVLFCFRFREKIVPEVPREITVTFTDNNNKGIFPGGYYFPNRLDVHIEGTSMLNVGKDGWFEFEIEID